MNDRVLRFLGKCNSWPLGWRLALAVAIVLLAAIARFLLMPEIGDRFVYVTYYPAVSIVTMMTGVAGGTLAAVLSLACAQFTPVARFDIADLIGAMGFVAGSTTMLGMAKLLQLGRARLAVAEAARRGEEQLRQFTEQAPLALAMLDTEMRYIAASRRWLTDRGLDGRELAGQSHYDIFPWVSDAWREAHRRALAGEVVRAEEELLHRPDGSERWQRWEVRPWHRADGKIGGVIIFAEDITARKQAEEKLRRSEALFRAMFENSAVGMAQVSPDGMFMSVNKRLCDTLGYSAEEFCRLSFADITHPDDLAAHLAARKRLLAGEIDHFSSEKRYIRKDGSCLWGIISVGAVRDRGGAEGYGAVVVEDISERKHAEQALQENERRLATDLDAMTRLHRLGTLVIKDSDPQPVLNEVVDTAIAIAGADFGNIQFVDARTGHLRIVAQRGFPQWWVDYWNAPSAAVGACATAFASGERVVVEDVDRSPIFVGSPALEVQQRAGVRAVTSTPLMSRAGQLVGMFSTHYRTPHRPDQPTMRLLDLLAQQAADIIEQMRANANLRESEARYRAIVDSAFASIVTMDENGIIQAANPATRTVFGYDPDELIGVNVSVLIPEERAGRRGDIEPFKRAGIFEIIGVGRELTGFRKEGSAIDIELMVSEWRDAAGERFFTGSIRDITDRKRVQDTLRKFSRVVEQTASTVVIANADGIIEYVNPRFSETSGYTAEEAIGKRPSMLKSGHTADAEYRELWQTITSGGVWRGEFHNRRKDGSLYWETAIISPIRGADGRITHYAAVKDDISTRKEIEGQFVAAQRLETVGRLAGSIAHDFNNLLAVIAGNLELIQQRSNDAGIQALVRPALNAAEAGAAFNRRLLSLSGRRRSEPRPFVVNERIQDTRILLECSLGAEIAIKYDLADDLWPSIADPGEIDSALLNLVTNSRDAMPNGGEIVIQTRNAAISADTASGLRKNVRAGDYVRISVIDNGEGMRKEVLERALEPFFTTKAEGRGTGLGLSSVHNFAAQAGGFITLESREQDGAIVSVYLPRAPIEKEGQRPAEDVPYGDGEVVLVVEDDDRVREVTLKRVEALGYVAEAARSGAEAIEVLKSAPGVDVILSDIVMPGGMTGFELARWARSEAPAVEIILATGFSGDASAGNQVALDVPILHKPYSREQLAHALVAALGRRAQTADTSVAKT